MPKHKRWIITTSSDRSIHEIAKDLASAGLKSGEVLEEIGSIHGTASEEVLPKLRKVRGVADVTQDTDVDVGPPGSKETW